MEATTRSAISPADRSWWQCWPANHRETARQFVTYLLFGILTSSVTYAVFLLLYRWFGHHYLLASGLGYCAGSVSSFLANQRFTFNARGRMHVLLGKFAAVAALALGIDLLAVHVCIAWLRIFPEVAQVLALMCAGFCNFVASKLWIFRPGRAEGDR